MKIPFLKTSHKKPQHSSKNNPVKIQCLNALNLLEEHLLNYCKKHKSKFVPLNIINLYTGIIISGAKEGTKSLTNNKEQKAHAFIIKEMEIMLGVFGASCLEYSKNYYTKNIPKEVATSFFDQMRKKIDKQK